MIKSKMILFTQYKSVQVSVNEFYICILNYTLTKVRCITITIFPRISYDIF